jgi:hypothetical protein
VELVRPDVLIGVTTTLPAGVTYSVPPDLVPASESQGDPQAKPQAIAATQVVFTNVRAANGGYINGTIQVTAGIPFVETYSLTVTPTEAPVSGTPAWTWTYTGQQDITYSAGTDSASVAAGTGGNALTAKYTDNSVSPAAVTTYVISTPIPLAVNWTTPTAITLSGEYEVTETGVEQITGTIAAGTPLVWDPATCAFPVNGTLTLGLTQYDPALTDSTTVVFSSACGAVTIGGASFNIGQ